MKKIVKINTYSHLFYQVLKTYIYIYIYICTTVPSTGAVEYTDCISAGGHPPPNKRPGYDSKQSDCEADVMLEFVEC